MFKVVVKFAMLSMLLAGMACSGGGRGSDREFALRSAADSVSYIIGMNIADNLIDIDTTFSVDIICRGIMDRVASKALFSDEAARNYFLKYYTYILPESSRAIEESYLEGLAKSQRRFTRTASGLTYHIQEIGNEQFTPRYNNDLVKVRYSLYRLTGDTIYSSYINGDTIVAALDDMPEGVKESLKMLGQGGKLEAVIPSKLLPYGQEGDSLLGIKPYETLRYEIELIETEKYGANKLQSRFDKGFR